VPIISIVVAENWRNLESSAPVARNSSSGTCGPSKYYPENHTVR
jgi:hypothetical protein